MNENVNTPGGDQWLTLMEVQEQAKVKRGTVHRWRKELNPNERLPEVKIGGIVRVRQSDLDAFLARHRQ